MKEDNNFSPLITSYTNIASVFSNVASPQMYQMYGDWLYLNYSNLCWNKQTNELIPCNYDNCDNYENIMNAPFLSVSTKSIDSLCNQNGETWINNGYSILLPINTHKMGITQYNTYVHDVYLTEFINGCYRVFDFWQPRFKWDSRIVSSDLVHHSIDTTNANLYNKIILMKHTKSDYFINYEMIRDSFHKFLERKTNKTTQAVGIDVYSQFVEYIRNISSSTVLPATNFQILVDHFTLLAYLLPHILKIKQYCSQRTCDTVSEHTSFMMIQATKLRNYALKVWYSNKKNDSWREQIISALYALENCERNLFESISE